MGRGDILALVTIVLIISAFAYYAYQQYTFSRTGRVILVEYRASKAWRKGDTWYFQSQSFSAGHVASHNIFAAFRVTTDNTRYAKLLIETQGQVNYIDLAVGKNGLRGYVYINGGRHTVEIFFNKTTVVSVKVNGASTKILEYGPWKFEGCVITIFTSSIQNHTLIIRFIEVKP
mgnify:CR=1 FL=1